MGSILLIRHGQASFGADDYDHLSPKGEEQARRLGAWLKQTGERPGLIALGSLRRHLRTADLCVEAAGVDAPRLELPGLNELEHEEILARHRPDLASMAALRAEMSKADDPQHAFQSLYVEAIARWVGGNFDHEYGRSWGSFRRAVLDALRTLGAHEAGTIWAFTSGGPIAVAVNALVGAPPEQAFALAWPVVNTSLTRIAAGTRRQSLISYNSWPHLADPASASLVTHR